MKEVIKPQLINGGFGLILLIFGAGIGLSTWSLIEVELTTHYARMMLTAAIVNSFGFVLLSCIYVAMRREILRFQISETSLQQREDALVKTNEELESRIAERTAHLIQVNEELVAEIVEHRRVEIALRQSESRYRHLVETIPNGILEMNTTGIITFCNQTYQEMLGYTEDELLSKSMEEFVLESEGRSWIEYLAQQAQNKSLPTPYFGKVLTKVGNVIDIQADWNYQQDNQGQVTGFIAIVTDITDRKRAEEMRRALERERELSDLRLRFFSMASHEFRTPLSTILMSAQVIESSAHNWSVEKCLRNVRRISIAAKHMTQLLNDILTINRAETGRLEFHAQPIDLEQFCQQLLDEIRSTTGSEHTLNFSCQGECHRACLDERLLRSILTNLLSNAVKYSPQGGQIDLELISKSEQVTLQVRDYGIGIPLDEQSHLFEAFHRGSNSGNIPGTGLGLTVVKKCVDLHGGTVEISSKVGAGTTFIITLPTGIGDW